MLQQKKEKNKRLIDWILENKKWFFLFFVVILFIEIVENLFENEIYLLDDAIYGWISNFISVPITILFKIITFFGGAVCVIGICIIAFLTRKEKKVGILMISNLVIAFALNVLLKNIFDRPRPEINRLIEEVGFSFPSRAFYGKHGFLWIHYIFNLS